ncbi:MULTISPECIES: beta-1,6-N-acetylglucosaminyltransferase [Herbaspirillum]|uniref:Peptide O-xylosyltransferase n=1 Tax=Herbaspirillum huttiense subsp. lycopersici TaxID=3074428 RepID=A0ABU2EGC6_9BURK|nr:MULTISPECIES: beta-1,6-N-acetylglucosaminyltransferase [Herbaspirillum]MDR6738153.1 hypothetical protein [Herbaspirillum sp. 1173]MDR9846933.1 beta-1,6-N-acetylglucosaminyltransferase [Herbaspirillum huttiense SE1]
MKIAYLILAHNNPRLLERLIAELSSERATFVLHIDSKADITQFERLRAMPRVLFCDKRINGAWGDFSLVQATLNMMELALQHEPQTGRVVLLSGSTLPVQPRSYIEDFFQRQADVNFMEAYPMPNEEYGKRIGRLAHYWVRRARPLMRYRWKLQDLIIRYAPLRDYRKALGELQPMAGSQWWAVTGEACRYMLDYHRQHPRLASFCKHVDCPDEFFFQTILGNSEHGKDLQPSITYTDWQPKRDSPETLTQSYLAHFAQPVVMASERHNCPLPGGEVLFARKFNEEPWQVVETLLENNQRKAQTTLSPH